jgi:hypothetical protein
LGLKNCLFYTVGIGLKKVITDSEVLGKKGKLKREKSGEKYFNKKS